MDTKRIFVLFILLTSVTSQLFGDNKTNARSLCPQLYQKTFRGYVPRGNITAGTFTEVPDVKSLKKCILDCCVKEECNVAFMTDEKCYHIHCVSNELCMPLLSANPETFNHVSMVLVRPVLLEDSWEEIIRQEEDWRDNINRERINILEGTYKNLFDNHKDLQMEGASLGYSVGCTINTQSCSENEVCIQNFPKSRAGTCNCKTGFIRNSDGNCVINLTFKDEAVNGFTDVITDRIINLSNTTDVKKKLKVTAENKEVKLPKNEVSLTASVSPPPAEDEKYQYEWTSLHQPEGSGAVKHQNGGEQLQLSKLSEGLYTFKISVTSPEAYGETFVNVTVLPPSRINQPPQIIITPANQTIKLPNTGAVLDASSSTDDDHIVSWHWELQQGPLGYNPQLQDTPTLQLNDLNKPGNYTFKLTVTDTDKATSSSTANVTVLKFTDYPPEANAGQDVIIYLPHNKLTLNGNLSTDDHLITTWEWTKSPDDADKAVDMQDTRTPYLQLSNLEEGMYTFVLKVTDSANQSSTAQVHVFVKPPTNKPPVAEAGDNITISLPQTWVLLNANKSKDDNKIESFKWEQVQGSSQAIFVSPNSSITNVTGLTKGSYIFKVYVTDDNKNVANDLVYVTVNQNKNQKPTANAGGNNELALPQNVIYVNGSKSFDDWAITKWKWVRNEKSLAIGNIGEKSDESPVLILTDISPGIYIFNLTVYDEQGLSDTDVVSITVKGDPMLYYLVDIILHCNVKHLTETQYTTLKGKLALLVKDGTKLKVRGMKPIVGVEMVQITFYVETADGKALAANDVVNHLREKLKVDAGLLGFSIAKLQTFVCQNNCSGHGVCDEQSRDCICEAFWMQDIFKMYFRNGEDSDCSWSILYVVLGVICTLVSLVGSLWGAIYLCINGYNKRNSKPTTYKLIEDNEDLPPFASRKHDLSDSDTDSDVIFESRNKPPARFPNEIRNGYKSSRNGFNKMGRRVKT